MPFVRDLTERHWPDHPNITIATDGGDLSGLSENVVTISSATWVEVLLGALKYLKERASEPYVFVMLEDLCPILPCDAHIIELAFEALKRSDAGVIEFSCFEIPFDSTDEAPGDSALQNGSRRSMENCGELKIKEIPRGFSHYFSVQPGIWRLEYLIDACEVALSHGWTSPWAFEEMRWEAARPHLITSYVWPATHHGFLLHGRPNPGAIGAMNIGVCGELRKRLIADAFGGPFKYRAWYAYDRVKRITARGVARRLMAPLIGRGSSL